MSDNTVTAFPLADDLHAAPNDVLLSNAWRPVVKNLSDIAGLLTDEQAAAIFDLQVEIEKVVFGGEG